MNQLLKTALKLTRTGDDFISRHGSEAFHEKAAELLTQAGLQELYQFEELVKASYSPDFNSHQNYAGFQFSDLPITLSMGEHCLLDLYFWRRRPTVIHDHHFTGAFQCLEGVNVDLEFEFKKTRTLGKFHDLGTLELKQSRTLKKGDIAQIDLQDKFIHQNHHQAELTINACFRTIDLGQSRLSNYLYSGVKFVRDNELLDRANRLVSFINIGEFDLKNLSLSIDDALCFMKEAHRSNSHSKKFKEVYAFFDGMIKEQLELDIVSLLNQHDEKMEEIESHYN